MKPTSTRKVVTPRRTTTASQTTQAYTSPSPMPSTPSLQQPRQSSEPSETGRALSQLQRMSEVNRGSSSNAISGGSAHEGRTNVATLAEWLDCLLGMRFGILLVSEARAPKPTIASLMRRCHHASYPLFDLLCLPGGCAILTALARIWAGSAMTRAHKFSMKMEESSQCECGAPV